jgi:L-iditol 2-dehydrogenase
MKIAWVKEPGKLEFAEVERPVPGPHDVVAKVKHCGVCGTDLSIADGTLNLGKGNEPIYPVRIGHEWSGVIDEVGSDVIDFKPGDPIVSDTGLNCGHCSNCKKGNYTGCSAGRSLGTIGDAWPGAFAEYILMPELFCYKIPKNVPLENAALAEPAGIGFGGLRDMPLGPCYTMLVIGTGTISLCALACAKALGQGKTILAGRKDAKLAIGNRLGADILVNMGKEDLAQRVFDETDGRGADVVLDATGAPELLNLSVSLARKHGGKIVLPGYYEQIIDGFDIDNLITNARSLIGVEGQWGTPAKILGLMQYRNLDLTPLITDRYPFENIHEAFKAMKEKNNTRIKIMVDF